MTAPQVSGVPQVVRLGAVNYLNARPLVFGLDQSPRFALRFDVPSECARLLHAGSVDVGLIPSVEYLHGDDYRIVPDLAIVSRGEVASVALFTKRPIRDVQSIAMDTSSRTSVALVRILCARKFRIQPTIQSLDPDLDVMLRRADAALVIGDNALLWRQLPAPSPQPPIEKIDLGTAWTSMTGLPFVWAFWAGRQDVLTSDDVRTLVAARDAGVRQTEAIARAYFPEGPARQALGARYLRDNIKYYLRDEEQAGLEAFYRYALEAGAAPAARELRFY
ncbi:MAG: menaquinone biosynthesis protein [Vicinamibacterales bacterium]